MLHVTPTDQCLQTPSFIYIHGTTNEGGVVSSPPSLTRGIGFSDFPMLSTWWKCYIRCSCICLIHTSPVNLLFFAPLRREFTPRTSNFCWFCTIHTRTRTFCEVCTAFKYVPGTFVSSVRRHSIQGTGTTCSYLCETSISSVRLQYPYPEFRGVLYEIHSRTRNFCEIYTPVPQNQEYGYNFLTSARSLCQLCTPVPQYPELL